MTSGKSRFVFTGYLTDIRFVLSVILLLYSLFALTERQSLAGKLEGVQNNLRILQQMQSYAKQVCTHQSSTRPKLDIDKDIELLRLTKRRDITRETVASEVTFILMGPTLRCVSGVMSSLSNLYKDAKFNVAIDVSISVINKPYQNISDATASRNVFLGGFDSRAEALNRAVELVSTKYFMIVDHSVDLTSMRDDFVQVLLSNMPGFDILSGSQLDNGEFTVPCYRLRLRNWSLHETYQYNVSGNVLSCDSTNLYFIARTEAFKHLTYKPIFDVSLPSKWLQDFFIRFQGTLAVGVVPEAIIHRKIPENCFHEIPRSLSRSEMVNLLLPFANKYQILYFDNETSRLSVCEDSNEMTCSEKNIGQKWGLDGCSTTGLTAYPFIIESLKAALHFGVRRLRESHLSYVIEGGTLLGLVKLRDILPWDHGDVDTFVYTTRRNVMNMVKKTYRDYGYTYWLRHTGFHTYVTNEPGSLKGCIVYLTRRLKPKEMIYMRHQGKLFVVKRKMFKFLRDFYGSTYFESHGQRTNERTYCRIPGHHACMPDCRWDGCGGGPGSFPGIL